MTRKSERQIWKFVTLITLDGVLAVVGLLGTNFPVEKLCQCGRKADEGGAGIEDNPSVVNFSSVIAKRDGIEVDLPVGLAAERDRGQLAGVVVLVDTTKSRLGLVTLIISIAEIESKDRLVEKTLLEHVVEGWDHAVDTNGVVAETQDSIKLPKSKGQTGLGSCFGKVLFEFQIPDLNLVMRNKALEATRAVGNLEFAAILLVR